jgi:hypothetical protein
MTNLTKVKEFAADLDTMCRASAATGAAVVTANASGAARDYHAAHNLKVLEDTAHEAFTAKWGPK